MENSKFKVLPDVRMITDKVDSIVLTVDNINNTVWTSSFFKQFNQSQTGGWVPFARFYHVGVSTNNSWYRERRHILYTQNCWISLKLNLQLMWGEHKKYMEEFKI